MITLPSKFADENRKVPNVPSFVVKLLQEELFAESTTQADWNANSEILNIDLTTSIGDAILGRYGDSWGNKAPRGPCKNMSSIISGDSIYIHGGNDDVSAALATTYRYDINSDAWTGDLGSAPEIRTSHTAVEYNGYMYVFNGTRDYAQWDVDAAYVTQVRRFNLQTHVWEYIGEAPFKRVDGTAIVYNEKVYFFGGAYLGGGYNDIWEFALTNNAWTQRQQSGASFPTASRRYAHTAVVWQNKMIVFGGNTANPDVNLDDCWEWNIDTMAWTEKAKGPSIRLDHAATVRNGIMLVYGGTNAGVKKSDLWEFDIEKNVWTQKTSDSTSRSHHIMQTYSDRAYAYGGTNGTSSLNDVRQYTYHLFYPNGRIRTKTLDLGIVPVSAGEWLFDDVLPDGTAATYEAWGSATGAFAGEEIYLSTVMDGDPITVLKRYYRVRATLQSDSTRLKTPVLLGIKADLGIYLTYSDNAFLGYEPELLDVSSLSTTIDTFNPSTIGQITLTLAFTQSISGYLKTRYPKNKLVKIFAGFASPGFTLWDYILFFQGQIDDWSINTDDTISLTVKDFKKEWDVKVPSKWNSLADDIIWTAQHPCDVMLDILRNKINVRDSKIEIDSFNTVKAGLAGWAVTRKITGEPEDGKTLLEELRTLISCFFIPLPAGRVKIKKWDPNEAAVDNLTDKDIRNVEWSANADSLINQYIHYYAWDGAGNNASDFANISINLDSASKTNWGETKSKEFKDKWTAAAQSAQVTTLAGKVLARYADPPSIISIEVDRRRIYLEVGDIVTVTTARAPSSGMTGIAQERYQIINRNLDFKKDWIKLKLLKVA